MALRGNPLDAYKKSATTTATPGQLVLMLYDGIIRFCRLALTGFDKDDPAERIATINDNIIRAQDIIYELIQSLDHKQGADVAGNFLQLYDYCERRLHESNMNKTPDGIEATIQHISELRNAWAMMLERGGQPMTQEEFQSLTQSAG